MNLTTKITHLSLLLDHTELEAFGANEYISLVRQFILMNKKYYNITNKTHKQYNKQRIYLQNIKQLRG